ADPDDLSGAVLACGGGAHAPAYLAVRAPDAKLGLVRLTVVQQILHAALKPFPIVRQDQNLVVLGRDHELAGRDAVNRMLPFIPYDPAGGEIPVPRAEVARRERKAAPLLALQQPDGGSLQFGGALRDPPLQLKVQPLELPVLAIEIDEDANLRAQD